ncbi:hypothetical protein TrST_g1503 [Triparma strigata]|uniref:Uncharacterized protein n=1 Tax=Triparma strigata TaxID=1606541 RepID=A0A9W7BIV9_9STRA|nr:hypothetical protein TrST_g1503 [Triparma strigata]
MPQSFEQQLLAFHEILDKQNRRIEEQDRRIEELEKKASEGEAKTGKFVTRWRLLLVVGALVPHGFALGSLVDGDMRLVAASRMFELFGAVCSIAAAVGNPRNFGSRNEKLFIGLCALCIPAHVVVLAYTSGGSKGLYIRACCWALICPPSFLGGGKLLSNLSDRKLGAAITALFKSLTGVLIPMLYISAESLRCIMDSSPDAKIDDLGYIERCGNPSYPTYWVSSFLAVSWILAYIIPPMMPSHRTLTWGDVMKLDMGRIEGLQFTLFCTLSIEALVMYAVTNEEGTELGDFLQGLMNVMSLNFVILGLFVVYEYIIKPAICRRSTTSEEESSEDPVTNPNSDAFSFGDHSNSIGL